MRLQQPPKLTVELVPKTCWWSNVRTNVSRADWEKCKQFVRNRSGDRCEICGGQGPRWPVECHEVWEYDYDEKTDQCVQRLIGLEALCPKCHEVKHIGRAFATGNAVRALEHLARVNGMPMDDVEAYVIAAYKRWEERSKHQWRLDVNFLALLGIEVPEAPAREAVSW